MRTSALHNSGHARRRALRLLIERDWPIALCGRCGARIDLTRSGLDPLGPTVGHRIPASLGGSDELDNLQLEHRRCNLAAGARLEPPRAVIAEPVIVE